MEERNKIMTSSSSPLSAMRQKQITRAMRRRWWENYAASKILLFSFLSYKRHQSIHFGRNKNKKSCAALKKNQLL